MWIAILLPGGACSVTPTPTPAEPDQKPLFVRGQDGYDTYRIPALLTTGKGTLLAFCEGRKDSRSDHGNIDLLIRRSTDGGETWSHQQVVWDDGGNTCGNPCPVVDQETGTIWLLLTHNPGDEGPEGDPVARSPRDPDGVGHLQRGRWEDLGAASGDHGVHQEAGMGLVCHRPRRGDPASPGTPCGPAGDPVRLFLSAIESG